ncbi:HAMP domain-containing sensor histidine kinase [Neobacillus niacini]|uniref:sensor histidine kinase n=1 Tax=Neobacillus niacini TaxID=86668 RepID=UPI000A5720EF|nr:HAMP domain-containing sensor histidine kinase [Neobacillus niacini]MEC1524928.1 HAMP domain-containing sensor histidine kinase [Neobacillus niacini]
MKNKKRTTLLTYWTTRYLVTLIIGLVLLGAGSLWWIQKATLENRLKLMEYLAVETANRVTQSNGMMEVDPFFNRMLEERARVLQLEKEPELFITNLKGEEIFSRPRHMNPGRMGPRNQNKIEIPGEVFENKETIQRLDVEDIGVMYAVKSPIMKNHDQIGWVVLMQSGEELSEVNQEYRLLFILLGGLGLLGWLVIYLLSKKILRPIQDVAHAAAQIKEGNYELNLNLESNEQEIYELVSSFAEMTKRLSQLEELRAELLAGVTHDLKTPVTSISGLIQAVRDGVVTGEEREEFLDITLKEVTRLQTMIADLLDFNSLAAGAFSIRLENHNLNELIENIVRAWAVTQPQPIDYQVNVPNETLYRYIDPLRLQQIMINLLNNAYQSIDGQGSIIVRLTDCGIDILDTGSGIPEEEQPYVFERFFRGEKKKLKVRGLGLGLPFSKMLAKALDGDLILSESSNRGSTFSIIWTKDDKIQ